MKNRRRWHSFAVVGVSVLALAVVAPMAHAAASSPASVKLSVAGGKVVADLRRFAPDRPVQLTARAADDVGGAEVRTSATGTARAAFQPAPGFSGQVRVTARQGARTAAQSIRVPGSPRPAATAASGKCSTGGRGGPMTDAENQKFAATDGRSGSYHLYAAGLPMAQPSGLLLYFHGDGAYEFENPDYYVDDIAAHAKTKNMITMSVLTPDSGTKTWWESGKANAEFTRQLVQKVAFAKYDIDRSRIWLVGYSGGSQFITKFFLPEHSELICGGGSIVFGGGGKPQSGDAAFPVTLKRNFAMTWYTGQDDTGENAEDGYDALSDAKGGAAHYKGLGFAVTAEHPAGIDHNSIPFAKIVTKHLDVQLPTPS